MITRNNKLKNRLRPRQVLVQKQINNNESRILNKKKSNNNTSNDNTSTSSSPSSIIFPKKTSPITIKINKDSPINTNRSNNNNDGIQNKPRPLGVRNSERIKIKLLENNKAAEPQPLRINRVRVQALDLLAKRDFSIPGRTEDVLFNERNKLLFMLGIGLIPKENTNKAQLSINNENKDSGVLKQEKGLNIPTPSVVLERLPKTLDKVTIQRLILEQKNKKKAKRQSLTKNSITEHLRKFAEVLALNNRVKLCPVRRKRNLSSSNSDTSNDENSFIPTLTLHTRPLKKLTKDSDVICIDLTNEPTEDTFFVEVRKRLSLCNTVLNVIC